MEDINGFHTGRNHDVPIAAASMGLDLDGRTNRWVKDEDRTEKKKFMEEFSEEYYKNNYGELVNNYDHFELIEKRT